MANYATKRPLWILCFETTPLIYIYFRIEDKMFRLIINVLLKYFEDIW